MAECTKIPGVKKAEPLMYSLQLTEREAIYLKALLGQISFQAGEGCNQGIWNELDKVGGIRRTLADPLHDTNANLDWKSGI